MESDETRSLNKLVTRRGNTTYNTHVHHLYIKATLNESFFNF